MKRGTIGHMKVKDLARRLAVPRLMAVGLLEAMWHFAAERAKAGDIGKYTDVVLAEELLWITVDETTGSASPEQEEKARTLIRALCDARWLDEDPACRLRVHDWSHHCDDAVHMNLARAGQLFADGTAPNLSRFSAAEKKRLRKKLEQNDARAHAVHTEHAQQTHCPAQPSPSPSPAQPSPAMPKPSPNPASGAGVNGEGGGAGPGSAGLAVQLNRAIRGLSPPNSDEADFERMGQVQAKLNGAKVNPAVVTELMRRRDITPKLVDETLADIRAGPNPPVDVAAVLVHRLREHRNGKARR